MSEDWQYRLTGFAYGALLIAFLWTVAGWIAEAVF